jgi:DNA-binding IclR family transcriptional regulator
VRLLESHRSANGDVFGLGTLIKELSGGQLFWRPLVQCARPELTAVRDETGETVGLHVLYAERRVLVDQVVSNHELRWVYGNHMVPMPLYAGAAAKMLLALLPEPDMLRLAKRGLLSTAAKASAGGPRTLQELAAKIERVREQRYSLSSEEINPGINSIAVPVTEDTRRGLPVTVISLAGPTARMTDKVTNRHLKRMLAAARTISARLDETAGKPA